MLYVEAYHHSAGHNLPVNRIVVHGTVSATVRGGARAVANYFQSPTSGGSAQVVVDPGEAVRCAYDDVIAWHAPPNTHSLGIEFCDWVTWNQGNGQTVADKDPFWKGRTEAEFNARWDLKDWDDMLRLGAKVVADWATAYQVPVTRLGVQDLLNGARGATGHAEVAQAWKMSDHTDPRWPDKVWVRFLGYVKAAQGYSPTPPQPAPTPKPVPTPVPSPGVLVCDGALGPATIRRWQQVMGTPVDGRISQKSSLVAAVQRRLNAALSGPDLVVDGDGDSIVQDGVTVTNTHRALQRYLGTPVDGKLSRPRSLAIVRLQQRLNAGKF